jgi:hypothetical protein
MFLQVMKANQNSLFKKSKKLRTNLKVLQKVNLKLKIKKIKLKEKKNLKKIHVLEQ